MKDQEKKPSKIKLKLPPPDFIPYTCHVDGETILLKNNHLLQTIKITGFAQELVGKDKADLKTTIRKAISKNIEKSTFAVYLHTIRKKKSLRPKGEFQNKFCEELDQQWNKLHKWENKFVNELFLTIIHEAKPALKIGKGSFISKFSFTMLKHSVRKEIQKNHEDLTKVTNNILKDLNNFGARKLAIYKSEGIYYSEPLRFLSKIINLNQNHFKLKENDISDDLIQSKMAFGSDSYYISNRTESYHGSLFSIKEYTDVSTNLLNKFLQLPMEFIITQSLSFVDPKETIEKLTKYQKNIKIGGDKAFARDLKIDTLIDFEHDKMTAFGRQQLMVNILAKSVEELKVNVEKSLKILISFGLTCVRENVYMENCFWSQLPGNFFHLIRKNSTTTANFGGFGSLSNFPAGSMKNNHWGEPISLFYTSNKTPYFFNFHHGSNGHSLILGPYGSGKTVLLNFLIAQAAKVNFDLYYFDFYNSSEIFINALDGDYKNLMLRNFDLKINPFLTDESEESKDFIYSFLSMLTIDKSEITDQGINQSPEKEATILQVAEQILILPIEQRNIQTVTKMLSETNLRDKMSYWSGEGKFAKFFDHSNDEFEINKDKQNIYGFDLTNIAESKIILYPLVLYFLKKIEREASPDRPSIVVLDEAWRLVDNPFIAPKLDKILKNLEQKNVVVIFASESINDIAKSSLTDKLTTNLSTQIFLPTKDVNENYKTFFNLNDAEFNLMNNIKDSRRNFLLKHGNEAITAELDLTILEDMIAILSSNEYGIEIMRQVKSKTGGTSEEWIPIYLDILRDIFEKDDIDFADLEEELLEIDINDYRNRAALETQDESIERIKQINPNVESAFAKEMENKAMDDIPDTVRSIPVEEEQLAANEDTQVPEQEQINQNEEENKS